MAQNHKREAERFARDADEAREDLQDLLVEAEARRRQFTELAWTGPTEYPMILQHQIQAMRTRNLVPIRIIVL